MPSSLQRIPPATLSQQGALSASRRSSLPRLLHLWHLLSLDAPSIATLWTAFIARSLRIHLPSASLVAMFLTVWALYAADRLLDAQPLHHQPTAGADLERRHLFHHRHRQSFLIVLAVVVAVLAGLIPQLPSAALHLFLILGTLLAGYFVLIHATSGAHRLPKELAVGIFFSAAVFIPSVARLPLPSPGSLTVSRLPRLLPHIAADPRVPLVPLALLFAALCCLNCLCIYAWEHPAFAGAAPHPLTAGASRHRRLLSAALLLAAPLAALSSPAPAIPLAIALSALALLLLDRWRHHLSPLTLRAAADLTLVTPVLFLPRLLVR